jgi:hypothetical protein
MYQLNLIILKNREYFFTNVNMSCFPASTKKWVLSIIFYGRQTEILNSTLINTIT